MLVVVVSSSCVITTKGPAPLTAVLSDCACTFVGPSCKEAVGGTCMMLIVVFVMVSVVVSVDDAADEISLNCLDLS